MVFRRRDFFVFIEGEVNGWDMVGWDYVFGGTIAVFPGC